jgi:hypothetical protein
MRGKVMAQAYVSMGAPMNHADEQRLLGSKYVPDLPGTSYWCSGMVRIIDPAVSMGDPAETDGTYWPGIRQEQLFIRVDTGDTAGTLASKVRTEVNAIATRLGVTVPAGQILITSYSRI